MKQPKTISIIVDSLYQGEINPNTHLYPYNAVENLLLALNQNAIANDIAKDMCLEPGHYWMLSPVFFHTTHNDVFMIGVADKNEQNLMYEALKKFAANDGFELYHYQDHLWLMRAANMPELSSEILPKVMHQSLKPFLDEWPLVWRQWFTEVQMLFHSLGFSTGNGVWLWGQGTLMDNYLLKPYPKDFKCNLPSHLVNATKTQAYDGSIMITEAKYLDDLQVLNQKLRHVRYLWQNTDYWQHAPSFWQKIVKWCKQKCK